MNAEINAEEADKRVSQRKTRTSLSLRDKE